MFYSKDLLSRKSPLGAIWTIAHGKKLSKSKLLGISVQEICNQIANPEVPHSLRLQGILVGGVVVVYNKQSVYLLEDVQDMVRQVREAIHIDNFGGKATLKRGKDKAKRGAIDLDDVVGIMDDAKFSGPFRICGGHRMSSKDVCRRKKLKPYWQTQVTFHTILLGVGGVIYTPHTLEPLKELGLDTFKATKLVRKLHAHSVMYAYKLASTRRALEKTFFNSQQ
ncbi:Rec8 like protein-domain-containing protein, partial [Dunaliella salina]